MFKFGNIARQNFFESTEKNEDFYKDIFLLRAEPNIVQKNAIDDNIPVLASSDTNINIIPSKVLNTNNWSYVSAGAAADYATTQGSTGIPLMNHSQWTIEFWCLATLSTLDTNARTVIAKTNWSVRVLNTTTSVVGQSHPAGAVVFYIGSSPTAGTIVNIVDNNWHHIAFTYDSSNLNCYLDGVLKMSSPTIWTDSASTMFLGAYLGNVGRFAGALSNIRISNINRYPSNFTLPTDAFENDANSIIYYNTPYVDFNNLITIQDGTRLVNVGPFVEQDPTIEGMFVGIDNGGTPNHTIADPSLFIGTKNFEFEFWIKLLQFNAQGIGGGAWPFVLNGSYYFQYEIAGYVGNVGLNSPEAGWSGYSAPNSWETTSTAQSSRRLKYNLWNHVVLQRFDRTLTVWINGSRVISSNYGSSPSTANNTISWDGTLRSHIKYLRLTIGEQHAVSAYNQQGFRYDKTATTITVPKTKPVIDPVWDKAYIACDGGDTFFGNRSPVYREMTSITRAGSLNQASITSYVPGFPSHRSIWFDGTNTVQSIDLAQTLSTLPSPPSTTVTGSPFTIEAWFKVTDLPTGNPMILLRVGPSSGTTNLVAAWMNSVGSIGVRIGSTDYNDLSIPKHNNWFHFAIVRFLDNTVDVFVNGSKVADIGSTDGSTISTLAQIQWGQANLGASYIGFLGYIHALRVTKEAVYNSNFSPDVSSLRINADKTLFLGFRKYDSFLPKKSNADYCYTYNEASASYIAGSLVLTAVKAIAPDIPSTYGRSYVKERDGSSYFLPNINQLVFVQNAMLVPIPTWTLEFWFYIPKTTSGAQRYIVSFDTGNTLLIGFPNNASMPLTVSGTSNFSLTLSSDMTVHGWHRWHHVALTSEGRGWYDGNYIGQSATTPSPLTFSQLKIGDSTNSNPEVFISNFHVVNFVKYTGTSSFSPSFSRPNPDSTTVWFLGGYPEVYDATGKIAVHQSKLNQIRSQATPTKYNSRSIRGSTVASNGLVFYPGQRQLGSTQYYRTIDINQGDFTIEFWYYVPTTASNGAVVFGTTSAAHLRIYHNSVSPFRKLIVNAYHSSGTWTLNFQTDLNPNAWNHVAVVKNGLFLLVYQNGLRDNLLNISTNPNLTGDNISAIEMANTIAAGSFIEDFRIVTDALYTGTSYTVPTRKFSSR